MSFTQKILIPLSDQVDTSVLEHRNVFEGEGDRITLFSVIQLYDDFDDNSIDPAKWNVTDSGSNVKEQNQQLEVTGNSNWNANGVVSDIAESFSAAECRFTVTLDNTSDNITTGYSNLTTLTVSTGQFGCFQTGPADNKIYFGLNGGTLDTGFVYTNGKTYKVRIVYQNPGWKMYIQSDDDATYSSEIEVFSTITDSTGPFYFQHNVRQGANLPLDDVYMFTEYSTASPSPAAIWVDMPVGAGVDMSTAKCWMFKDGVIQAAGNTDVKFKYAANNGALSSALTLTALRAEGNPTITDDTNSFKAVGVYASDGSYESKSSAWLEVDAIFPENGGGGGLGIINGGILNV
ncbi:hypothetical protein KAR91_16920 [Candidatus Pacearchaeota archaeon]|nr:hypothetical protein [Candidatus Pacearchaeota archaeon]